MIRHISVFTFKNVPEKAANIQQVRAILDTFPDICPLVKNQIIAAPAAPTPPLPEDAPIMFGDLVQICDFETPADAAAYPASEAHTQLAAFSTPMMRKVTTIDYEI